MPISTLTAITPIAEGSEATPGLWNSRFSQLQQNVQELNIQAIGLLSGFVTGGSGSPESVQTGTPGFIYVQLDAAAEQHPVWVKFTGSGTTGWRGFDGFQGTGVDSYQIGRGASATGLNASALGPSSGAAASASQAWGYLAAANQPSAIAVGPNSRASGPNALAAGLNTYAGQINSAAVGSAVTSNATGGWGFGTGVQVSHQSSFVISPLGASSRNTSEAYFDYPVVYLPGEVQVADRVHFSSSTTQGSYLKHITGITAGGVPSVELGSTASLLPTALVITPGSGVTAVPGQINAQVLLYGVPGSNYERFEITNYAGEWIIASTYTNTGTIRPISFNVGPSNSVANIGVISGEGKVGWGTGLPISGFFSIVTSAATRAFKVLQSASTVSYAGAEIVSTGSSALDIGQWHTNDNTFWVIRGFHNADRTLDGEVANTGAPVMAFGVRANGHMSVGTSVDLAHLTVNGRVNSLTSAPASGTAAGQKGDMTWGVGSGTTFLYVCISTNSWFRTALSPF